MNLNIPTNSTNFVNYFRVSRIMLFPLKASFFPRNLHLINGQEQLITDPFKHSGALLLFRKSDYVRASSDFRA